MEEEVVRIPKRMEEELRSVDVKDGQKFDIVIVGCGIAGASLSYALGKEGFKVAVVERNLKEPDTIVGELLQPGGILKLRELGLEDCTNGIDQIDVYGYAVITKTDRTTLKYPTHKGEQILGKSFHHGRFVQNLRRAASSVSNVTLIQATASRLIEDGDTTIGVEIKQGETTKRIYGHLNVVCDGHASNLRSKLGIAKPTVASHFVGVLLENCTLPIPYHGHVFLAEPAPVLSYQIGSNETRVLVDVPEPIPRGDDLTTFLRERTAPQLPDEIRQSFLDAIDAGKVRKMPNCKLHSDKAYFLHKGIIAVGDAWNMRHPLTGGGMTVALSDVVIVRDILRSVKDIKDQTDVYNSLQKFFTDRKPMASTINILAFALYEVFCSPDDEKWPSMRNACVGYFKLGGSCVTGPVSLLSGLNPNPFVLLYHFFLVALYGVYRSLKPFPTPARIYHAYKVLSLASWMVIPLMRGEKIFGPFTTLLSMLFVNYNKVKPVIATSD